MGRGMKRLDHLCQPSYKLNQCFCFRVGLAVMAGRRLAALGLQATTLNAIRDAWSGGLGEIPGRRTSLFCQGNHNTRLADGVHGSGYRTWNRDLVRSFLMPGKGTCTPARQIPMSVLAPETCWGNLDIERVVYSVVLAKHWSYMLLCGTSWSYITC